MRANKYEPGDWVVYRKRKSTPRPGPRAREVQPSPRGECYSYYVDKFWLVVDAVGDQIVVTTRRGKRHLIDANSEMLRRAGIWDRLVNGHRFPDLSTKQAG